MNITRRDLNMLVTDRWLNDNVINFDLNLIADRSEKERNHHFMKVYTMNTYFVERLLQSG